MKIQVNLTDVRLETDRLFLRPFQESDEQDMFAYASVPGVGEMAGWPHHQSLQETREVIRMFMEEKNVLALVLKETGRVIGSFGLHGSWANKDERYQHLAICEIGYVLSRAHWGKGLMPEAVRRMIRFCFEQLHLDAVTVCHFVNNPQSRRVIEKCGFAFCQKDMFQLKYTTDQVEEMQYILFRPECREVSCPDERAMIAEAVLRTLPDWFGIEEATRDYIEKSRQMPLFALFSGEKALGFGAIKQHFEKSAEIYVMGLRPEYHGMGLGRQLMDAMKEYGRACGIRYLQVKTLDASAGYPQYDRTRAFYLSQGFQPLECIPELWDPGNPCLIMIQNIDLRR